MTEKSQLERLLANEYLQLTGLLVDNIHQNHHVCPNRHYTLTLVDDAAPLAPPTAKHCHGNIA